MVLLVGRLIGFPVTDNTYFNTFIIEVLFGMRELHLSCRLPFDACPYAPMQKLIMPGLEIGR
jgi:hypothetical protein